MVVQFDLRGSHLTSTLNIERPQNWAVCSVLYIIVMDEILLILDKSMVKVTVAVSSFFLLQVRLRRDFKKGVPVGRKI